MRTVRRVVVAVVISLSALSVYGACLSEYNQDLYGCDSTGYGFFTRQGCRADALASYYGCLLEAATS